MEKFIINRFEGSYAICEIKDKTTITIPKYRLPLACKEGDCLILDSDGMYQIDTQTTDSKEKNIKDKISHFFE